MRKNSIVFVAVLGLGTLVACGSSGSESSDGSTTTAAPEKTTTTTEAPVAVKAWAESFCADFDTWTTTIGTASEGVGEGVKVGDAVSSQTAVADLYGTMSNATQTLVEELEAKGAPDVDDGEDLVDDLVASFEAFDQAAKDVRAKVEELSTDDIASYQAELDELAATFQQEIDSVTESFDEIDADFPSPELAKALVASCA